MPADRPTDDADAPGGPDRDWTATVAVDGDEPAVGDRVSFSKRLTEADVAAFADASGDTNPLHLEAGYAKGTRFGGRVVHGALVAGLVSAALARLPGVVIYLSQQLTFVAPVPVGDEATATVEVVEVLGGGRLRLAAEVVREDGEQALEGEVEVLVDEPPAERAG